MSRARKVRTDQARKVLADTHIARPILSGVRSAIATKRGNLRRKWQHGPMPQEVQDQIDEHTANVEALDRVAELLKAMNAKAFETIRKDLRRDISAEIASAYAPAEEAQ